MIATRKLLAVPSPLFLSNLRIQFGTCHEDTRDDVPRPTSFLGARGASVCGVGAAFPLLLGRGLHPSHRSKPDFVNWFLLLQRSVQVPAPVTWSESRHEVERASLKYSFLKINEKLPPHTHTKTLFRSPEENLKNK